MPAVHSVLVCIIQASEAIENVCTGYNEMISMILEGNWGTFAF